MARPAVSNASWTGKRCADASHPPLPWCVFGRPVVGSVSVLADAPADTTHPRRQHATGQHVERHLGPHARLDVLQTVLTQEGVEPDQPRVKKGQRRLAGGRELPDAELQVAYQAVAGRV